MILLGSERGVAFILALLIITLLFVIVLDFNQFTRVDISLAANVRDESKAEYIGKSGIHTAIILLKADTNDYDAPSEDWGKFAELSQSPLLAAYLEEGNISTSITDESGKINVNTILNGNSKSVQQLQRIFEILDSEEDSIDSIKDWIDPDQESREEGAEDDYYSGMDDPYPCKDGPLETISELLLVKGITEELYYGNKERKGLREFITAHSDGKININTANATVLETLAYWNGSEWEYPITGDLARQIEDYRDLNAFEKVTDLQNVPGLGEIYSRILDQITVKSNYFTLNAVAKVHMAEKRITAIVKRQRVGEENDIDILYWAVE